MDGEGSGKGKRQRTYRSGDGGDEVLVPGGGPVVLELEDVLLGESGATKELQERSSQYR